MRPLTFGMTIVCTSRRGGLFCASAPGALESNCVRAAVQMIRTPFIQYLRKTFGLDALGHGTLLFENFRLLPLGFTALILDGVDSQFSALPATSWNRQEKAMKTLALPSEISGRASAQSRGNFGEQPIMVGVVHLKDVNYAFPTGNINTFVLGVIVQII